MTIAPNYLHIGMQPFAGRRVWENRLSLPVTLRFNVGNFRLSDRNHFERRLRNSGVKPTVIETGFRSSIRSESTKLGLSLFVADEVFYDWSCRSLGAATGSPWRARKVFNKHFTQDFYYLRQNDGFSIPGDLNVIGTILRFRL